MPPIPPEQLTAAQVEALITGATSGSPSAKPKVGLFGDPAGTNPLDEAIWWLAKTWQELLCRPIPQGADYPKSWLAAIGSFGLSGVYAGISASPEAVAVNAARRKQLGI